MQVPLMILAVGAIAAGFLNVPDLFAHDAEHVPKFLEPVFGQHVPQPHGMAFKVIGAAVPTALACLAAFAAYRIYLNGPDALAELTSRPAVKPVVDLVAAKYGVDAFYDRTIVQQLKAGASSLWEYVDVALIDNTVNGVGALARFLAARARRLQPGVVNQYAFYVAAGAAVILFYALRTH
jgi:NADH-quinone oxidoreductase subunit L